MQPRLVFIVPCVLSLLPLVAGLRAHYFEPPISRLQDLDDVWLMTAMVHAFFSCLAFMFWIPTAPSTDPKWLPIMPLAPSLWPIIMAMGRWPAFWCLLLAATLYVGLYVIVRTVCD